MEWLKSDRVCLFDADRAGTFDRADGGTLFLDEPGELSVSTQARLLRVLEDGIVEPVGEHISRS